MNLDSILSGILFLKDTGTEEAYKFLTQIFNTTFNTNVLIIDDEVHKIKLIYLQKASSVFQHP